MNSKSSSSLTEYITLALIRRPWGIRGQVIATPLTNFQNRFDYLKQVTLADQAGTRKLVELESVWTHKKDDLIIKLGGVDSISQAELLVGCKVQIPFSERMIPAADEFFIDQLVGCRVELQDSSCLGEVISVSNLGGGDMLIIRPSSDQGNLSTEYMVPFVRSICTKVDISKKCIYISPPEGLLEI